MFFEAALDQELKGITAFNNRVYPLASTEANAKKGVPYCIYVSSEGVRTKSLGEGYGTGRQVSGEINIVTADYKGMKLATKEVIELLVGMERREIGTDGPYIQELTYENPVELYEEKPALYRCLIDFEVYFDQGG